MNLKISHQGSTHRHTRCFGPNTEKCWFVVWLVGRLVGRLVSWLVDLGFKVSDIGIGVFPVGVENRWNWYLLWVRRLNIS